MLEYRILTQKDKLFSRRFDAFAIEEVLNSLAQEGWRVISCTTAPTLNVVGTSRDELVIVMERDVSARSAQQGPTEQELLAQEAARQQALQQQRQAARQVEMAQANAGEQAIKNIFGDDS